MRITYLNVSGQMGGAETSLLQLLASVRTAQPGWRLSLVLAETGPLAAHAEELGVHTQVVPFPQSLARFGDSDIVNRSARLSHSFARAAKAFKILRQTRIYANRLSPVLSSMTPDLIHATGFKMHLLALWARPNNIPVIWHIHDYVSQRPIMRKALSWHSNKCAAIIVNSKSVRKDVLRCCPRHRDVTTLYNSINFDRFTPSGPAMDLDAASGFAPAEEPTMRVGLLASFAKWKGHGIFLKAVSLLPGHLRMRAYVIGGPIYQTEGSQYSLPELVNEADRLGLSERVGFTGFIKLPESAIRALDIVIHASTKPEPFGMAIVEAMACGKPVVASNLSGASEIFDEGQDVLTYPCGNAEEMADRIATLLADSNMRWRMGESGRRSVETILQGSRLSSELVDIYRRTQCASRN